MEDKIFEFTYRPKNDKSKVTPLFYGVLLMSLLIALISINLPRFSGVVSLVSLVGLCYSLYLYTRFIASNYAYTVSWDSSGDPIFIVTKLTGKKATTMFSIKLKQLKCIEKFTKVNKLSDILSKQSKKYNYTQSYKAKEIYLLKSGEGRDECEVILECTDEVAKRLYEYSLIAKRTSLDEERY